MLPLYFKYHITSSAEALFSLHVINLQKIKKRGVITLKYVYIIYERKWGG